MKSDLVKFLEWDSDFFGYRIAMANMHRLDAVTYPKILEWCESEDIRCLYFLADSNDPNTLAQLHKNDFQFIDTRVCYEKPLDPNTTVAPDLPDHITIRPANPNNIERLYSIAHHAFLDSRFYADPHIPNRKVDKFYQTWIHNSILKNFASATIVAEINYKVVGFLILKYHHPYEQGNYSLMSISPEARGQGLAYKLMTQANYQFVKNGMSVANVITQGRNIIAQRLYQKGQMRLTKLQYWYHKWFTN